jgi:anti-sigma B factor antagonist
MPERRQRKALMEFYYKDVEKDVLILSADGGLNADNADEFVGELETLVDSGIRKLVVDCTRLNYISSYGISILVRLRGKLAKRGGDVKLASVHNSIVSLLEIADLHKIFGIYANVDEALLAFGSERRDA